MLSILCDVALKWAREKPLKEILAGSYYDEPMNIDNT